MDSILPIAVWISVGLIGLALLAMVLFGLRSILHGKINPITAVVIVIPVVLLGILGVVMGDWAVAGIWTMVIMFALAVLGLLLSGIRGLFT